VEQQAGTRGVPKITEAIYMMFQLAAVLKALQKHQLKLNCKTDST
jgi:hypothetical protein